MTHALPTSPNGLNLVTSWTNGRKAVVYLLEDGAGKKVIRKAYRPGFFLTMLREYVVTKYIAARLSFTPRVLAFSPRRGELWLSYVRGQRVLEWVLQRFADEGVSLSDFQSFHGLDPDHLDERVAVALERFRRSDSPEVDLLKRAIRTSYAQLHAIGILHGSADPRNMIYDDGRIAIIDFDHARPSFSPARLDYRGLAYWYGLSR